MTGRTMICGGLERHAYTSAIVVSDGCVMSSVSALRTSTTLSESARMTTTPGRLRADSSRFCVAAGGDDEDPAAGLERVEVADQLARLGRVEAQLVDDADRAVVELGRQRAVQREALHALGQALLVAARMRPEDHATARVVRRAARALAGAAGALLAIRLGAAAADLAARLGVVRAGPAAGELRGHGLVHDGLVDRRSEQRLRQIDRAQLLAGLREEGRAGHYLAFLIDDHARCARRAASP